MGKFGKPWKGDIVNGKFVQPNTSIETIPILKANARVHNARKVINLAGDQFDSTLEMFMAGLLSKSGIVYERQKVFVLQDGFREPVTNDWIREIKWVVDFWIPSIGLIIDTKGWATEIFILKYKIFQYNRFKGLYKEVLQVKFAKNQNQCILVLSETKALVRDNVT
ncbi:MAG: DUF1064 domain-containing protein [Parachlamydiales bacterium]|jgi:hypothetical protein